ncbi:MAG: alpha/beta fold hydrolase [Promethearchaeota archaeon]
MYFLEQGEGYPIILLHGGTGSSGMWENIISQLAKHFRVITPDSRGHGKSDNPTNNFSYKLMADDIIGLIKALDLQKPIICGHSDGGQIALELAIHNPNLIKAIVVSGILIKITEDYIKGLNSWGIEKMGVVNFEKLEDVFKDLLPIIKERCSAVYGPDYWKTLFIEISKMWLNPEEFPKEKVKDISLPVLIVHGDRDVTPVEEVLEIHNLIPNSALAIAPNSDHFFVKNNFKLYYNLIIDFIQNQLKKNS